LDKFNEDFKKLKVIEKEKILKMKFQKMFVNILQNQKKVFLHVISLTYVLKEIEQKDQFQIFLLLLK